MQKCIGIIVFIFLCVVCFLFLISLQSRNLATQSPEQKQILAIKPVVTDETTLFVPYWTLDMHLRDAPYSNFVYFGITVDGKGIDTKEDGYLGITSFLKDVPSRANKLVALRMTNKTLNETLLQNQTLEQHIVSQTIQIAKDNGFAGIVLDLEYGGLAFPSVTQSVTTFSTTFAKKAHENHIAFYQTLFGDTFYLARPYNVQAIGRASDGIFVMSYDFHKANGTPGPNFPLEMGTDADYDLTDVVNYFSNVVDRRKLTFIFGMFGYDWIIDSQGRSIGTATSLTTLQMQNKFSMCSSKNCAVHKNASQETAIFYTDNDGSRHVVWYENMVSVKKKEAALGTMGIGQVGFWAYGYF